MDPELSEADIKALSAISQSVAELGARTAAIEGFIQNQVAINERTTANLERIFEALEKLQEGRMPELRFRFRIPPEEVDKVKSEVVKSESSPVVESEVIKADSPLPLVETSQLPGRAPPRDLKEPGPFSVSDVLRLGDVLGSEVHSGANSSLIPLIMVEDMFMRPSAKPPDVLTDDYFGLNVMGIVLRFKNLFGEVAEVQNRTVKELRKKKIVCKMSPSMSSKEMIWKLADPANILELLDALESDVTKPDLEKFRGTVLMSQATLQFIQCIDLPSDYSIPEEIKSKGFEIDTEELGSIVEGHDHDGLGRVASILLVVFVTITSDYRQSLQFKDLDREKKKITAQVIRDGGRQEISIYNMLVDDTLEMLKIGKLIAKAEKVDINEERMSAGSIKRYMMVRATRGVREGGWYFEIQMVHLGESGHTRRGWSTERRLGEAMNIGVGRAAAAAASADVPVPNEDESIFHQAASVEEVENEDGLIDNQTASVGDSEELVLIGLNPTNTSLELLALSCVNQERLALGVSDTVEDDEISCIAAKCIVPKKLGIKSRPVSDQGMEALAKGCSNSVNVKVKKCRAVTHEGVDCLITNRESIVVNLHTGDLGPQDPFAIDGVAFKKTFAYARFEQQPKRFGDPKILLPNIELELKLERENAEIRLSDPSQYQSIIDASGMFVRMLSQSSAKMIQVRDFKMRIFICKVVWHWRVQTCGSVCSRLFLRSELLAEFPSSIHGRNQIALFSLPRPPEDVNLEDKIKLKEGGMMRIGNIRAQL